MESYCQWNSSANLTLSGSLWYAGEGLRYNERPWGYLNPRVAPPFCRIVCIIPMAVRDLDGPRLLFDRSLTKRPDSHLRPFNVWSCMVHVAGHI